MTLTPGTKLGPYEILASIGAGGMGEVYRARDPRVGRDVAIKVSSEKFTDRFTREVHVVASLNHSNICTLYDVGSNYLVMELVEGPTLADRIKQGPIPLEESLEIARQIADALEAAHEKGIVHRDLKPGNIKLRPDGTVKVLDFGLAKVEETAAISLETSPTLSVAQTAAGVLLGTAAYMSPEQARGKPVDKRADIWAFGVVLYEMLTGKQLFSGETVSDTLAATLKEEPDLQKVPAKVRPLLNRCLEKDPKKRLRDIGEAMAWIESSPVPVPESGPLKYPWLWKSIAAVFIVAFALVGFVHFREKPPISNPRVQFQITLPQNMSVGAANPFALSPDGKRLAFWGAGSDGVLRLWIHALDSMEAQSLPGTDQSRPGIPYWSPDSRFIAYGAGGKLRRVDVAGGPAQDICDLSGYGIGGSWNRDDMIVFGDFNASNKIMKVPARGGVPTPVTELNSQDICTIYPMFLPDGRHFLYLRRSSIPDVTGIYVGSLDAKPEEQNPRRLLASTSLIVYAPSQDSASGQLLFLRGKTLMAQQFDCERLELTGDPVSVVENVGSYLSQGYFTASTNGILVYRNEFDQLSQPAWFDHQGIKRGIVGKVGSYEGVALSPDGTQTAVGYQNDIWLVDLLRGTNRRLTLGQNKNTTPVWSPDGRRIIFSSNRGRGMMNLYEKSASGAKEEKLILKSEDDKTPTSISRDGRFLLYTANNPKTRHDIWVCPVENGCTGTPLLHTEFSEFDGHFSPDMRWIAYVSDDTGSSEIYVAEIRQFSGKQSLEVGERWQISQDGGTAPRWKGNGKELYYHRPDGRIMSVEVTAGAVFRPGTPRTLFQSQPLDSALASRIENWDVALDGDRFLMATLLPESLRSPFKVVLNWTSLLKK